MASPIRATNLRSVDSISVPKTEKKLTVAQAAASGDHHLLLTSMRERIARAVSDPECPPRDLASLTRRLQDIAKEIDVMELRMKEEAFDDHQDTSDEQWDASAL